MDEGRSVESSKVRPIIRTVVAVLLFLFYMFPFFMIVLNSFKDKRDITKLPLSFGGKKGFTIDNYITASESQKIGSMDDFTLLDFIISQENKLKSEQKGEQESAAETIENNIRKKVVERMVINPAYYAKMSEILEQLILDRRRGVIAYGQLLDTYMELAKNVAKPEENTKYPESIRSNGALRALYEAAQSHCQGAARWFPK